MKQHYDKPTVLSAQGVTARQYLECVERIVPMLEPSDVLGLGGWCIIGKSPSVMLPVFKDTVKLVIPYAAAHGVRRVHIWGVLYAPALTALVTLADEHGIQVSTDSVGPSLKPCFGDWGYDDWRDKSYKRPPVAIRGIERARHVQATRDWLARFQSIPRQLEMFQ